MLESKTSFQRQSVKKYLRLTLDFTEIMYYRKSLISIFQEFLAIIDKIFILAGRPHTRVSFYQV